MIKPKIYKLSAVSDGLTIAATSYGAGDQVGKLFTFALPFSRAWPVYVVGVKITCAVNVMGTYDVLLYENGVTLAADNAAAALSIEHMKKLAALVPLSGAVAVNTMTHSQALNLKIPIVPSNKTLYASLVTRGAHSFFTALDDITLQIYLESEF